MDNGGFPNNLQFLLPTNHMKANGSGRAHLASSPTVMLGKSGAGIRHADLSSRSKGADAEFWSNWGFVLLLSAE